MYDCLCNLLFSFFNYEISRRTSFGGAGPSVSKDGVTTFEVIIQQNPFLCTGKKILFVLCLFVCVYVYDDLLAPSCIFKA